MNKNAKIAVIIGVLAVIAIVAYFVYKNGKDKNGKEEKEPTKVISPAPSKDNSTVSNVLNLSGEVMKDVANSNLLA